MKLTIAVTTMPSRASHLSNLVSMLGMSEANYQEHPYEAGSIKAWTDKGKGVELIAYLTEPYDDKDPRLTFGAKRNAVLEIASGTMFMCFDDDDEPHPQFLDLILPHCKEGVDVIGYKVACYGYANGCQSPEVMEPADVSTKYNGWYNDYNGFKYVRCPHHIVPVKREHVQAIRFKDMHHGEDHEYSIRMRDAGLLKNEVYIDEFMYVYRFNAKKSKGE